MHSMVLCCCSHLEVGKEPVSSSSSYLHLKRMAQTYYSSGGETSVLCKAYYHLCIMCVCVFVYEMPLISAEHCSLVLSTGNCDSTFWGVKSNTTLVHTHI